MKGFDIPVRSSSPTERYPFERITLIFSLLQRKKNKFWPGRGLNPWPLRYRCSNLPVEPANQLGAAHQAVHIHDFHIFTVSYSSPHGLYRTNMMTSSQLACSLPVGLLAQLVEYCDGRGHGFKPCTGLNVFSRPSFHYCEDRFRIHVFIRSSYIWFSYLNSQKNKTKQNKIKQSRAKQKVFFITVVMAFYKIME